MRRRDLPAWMTAIIVAVCPIVLMGAYLPGSTGTVTSVICGSGLSGGTITTTGTCSVTNPYDPANLAATGGTINGVAIGGTTRAALSATTGNFNGILTQSSGVVTSPRVVTAAGAVAMATTDYHVIVNKTSGAATTVNLVSSPTTGTLQCIKDGKGDAATNNITLTPAAGNIDGAGTFVMNQNYEQVCIVYNGTQWNVF